MIAILDYGSGNLRSAERAFELTGHEIVVTADPTICASAEGLVVPGVGAFGACMEQLKAIGGEKIILARSESGKALFGICVGMQILFTSSEEKGVHAGVNLFPGAVSKLKSQTLPHMGWNSVTTHPGSRLLEGIEGESFYFVHSFAAKVEVAGGVNIFAEYGEAGEKFLAAVERENICATQFHPEKSGAAGAKLIQNWAKNL